PDQFAQPDSGLTTGWRPHRRRDFALDLAHRARACRRRLLLHAEPTAPAAYLVRPHADDKPLSRNARQKRILPHRSPDTRIHHSDLCEPRGGAWAGLLHHRAIADDDDWRTVLATVQALQPPEAPQHVLIHIRVGPTEEASRGESVHDRSHHHRAPPLV